MNNDKNNIIYIDFLITRKKINSKLLVFLYRLYHVLINPLILHPKKSNSNSKNVSSIKITSNYWFFYYPIQFLVLL